MRFTTLTEARLAQAAGKAWVQAADNVWGQAGVQMTENSRCATCLGRSVGTFGRMNALLKCISANSRHFPGRMDQDGSQVSLTFPATVTASALTGEVTDPREFVPEGL
jgi:3-isopropylmalate/(R)-2-methylmalate dehydratase large subunit